MFYLRSRLIALETDEARFPPKVGEVQRGSEWSALINSVTRVARMGW